MLQNIPETDYTFRLFSERKFFVEAKKQRFKVFLTTEEELMSFLLIIEIIFTMEIIELEKMWEKFSNIPINDEDEIEQDFYWWESGTYRFDIWHWFDEKFPNGIAKYII